MFANPVGTLAPTLLNGRFRLGTALPAGGQSTSFFAWDEQANAACVLKFGAQTPAAQASLGTEFSHLRGLAHPHIVRVLDVGRVGDQATEVALRGRPYLALAAVDGPSLRVAATQISENGRAEWLWRVACDLTDALAYLHQRNLLHGDVTPANVGITSQGSAVLLDFGLAWQLAAGGSTQTRGGGQGTMGFAAPEALAGNLSVRSDLFGLGATLYWAWCQKFAFGDGPEGVARMLAGHSAVAPGVHLQGMPTPLEELIVVLLAPAPRDRPANATAVLRSLQRLGAELGWAPTNAGVHDNATLAAALAPVALAGDPLAGVFVGRDEALATLDRALSDLLTGCCAVTAIVISGLPGVGRRTLLREAVARAQVRALAAGRDLLLASPSTLANAQASVGTDPAQQAANRWAQVLAAAEARSHESPVLVLPDDEASLEHDPAAIAHRLNLVARQKPGRCLYMWMADAPPATTSETVLHLALGGFSLANVEALLASIGLLNENNLAEQLLQLSHGLPALLAVLVRQRLAGLPLTNVAVAATAPAEAFAAQFRALPITTQAAVLSAWWDLPPEPSGAQDALQRGWIVADAAGRLGVPDGLHKQALWGASRGSQSTIKAVAAAASQTLPLTDPRRAEALRVAGDMQQAFMAFLATAAARWERSEVNAALWCWAQAEALGVEMAWPAKQVALRAQALGLSARYDNAEAWLRDHPLGADAPLDDVVASAELRSWLCRRKGQYDEAAQCLSATEAQLQLKSHQPSAALAQALARLRVRRARLLVSQGRHAEALTLAQQCQTQDDEIERWHWETVALAAAYLGQWETAHAAIASWQAHAQQSHTGRIAATRGLLAQLQQDVTAAGAAYLEAIALFDRVGDSHGSANARLNLAMVLAEQGRYADSLAAFQHAYKGLLRVGAFGDATAAAFNAGLLFARLGDEAASAAAEAQLRQASQTLGTQAAQAWTFTLSAERAWHNGRYHDAAAAHERASALFIASGDPLRAQLARLAQCEALCLANALAPAQAALNAAHEVPLALGLHLRWARARLALAGDATQVVAELASQLAQAAQADQQRQRLVDAFRSAALAAQLFFLNHDQYQASRQQQLALQLHREISMHTPPDHRAALLQDPDALWLSRASANASFASSETNGSGMLELAQKLAHAQARLRRFVRLSKRLNSELRLPRLLETVLDTVIELTEAERGFLLLREGQGELVVRAARNIEQTSLEGESLAFSRSIAEQVARTGTPIITVDAAADDRFAQALSVSDLQLRSVVAVPLTIKGQVEGTIYVDNRLRHGAFTDDDVATLLEFSELAALAIGNTRLIAELKRRDRQIESLNRRLQADLAARKDEISAMRVELTESRESFALRFDYHNLVGRSPRMMELLRLLDRVSETNLPVVIQGESGTGKELVARALVANGARKDKAFVTENCAAIPETLLESTLFGYVRGAFTGADKDTRGLFSVAHEGTLFLDEVGEMSAALQGKLLRVLQEGEYRRVGGQRNERTDVRVIVATNRDLESMVAQGRFRQDLFFRLAVVRVTLPPLRERTEDIPLLVRHFLQLWQGRAGIKATSISPDALARLCAYRWPGNVRELENEVGRAAAFANATITVADLSPHLAGPGVGKQDSAVAADDLSLKPRVENLEKGLLREALARFGGNQSRAAEALGLSRFGLQKKLRRYGLEA